MRVPKSLRSLDKQMDKKINKLAMEENKYPQSTKVDPEVIKQVKTSKDKAAQTGKIVKK